MKHSILRVFSSFSYYCDKIPRQKQSSGERVHPPSPSSLSPLPVWLTVMATQSERI